MEAILKAYSDKDIMRLVFYNNEDLCKYIEETDGEDIIVTLKPEAKTSEKMRMYAFYHGPVLHCAMMGYTAQGWEGMDKVVTDYKLRAEFAKDFVKNPQGQYEPYIIGRSDMTKNRFLKYLQDVLLFIEMELKMRVPDSEEWKMKKFTGKDFRKA